VTHTVSRPSRVAAWDVLSSRAIDHPRRALLLAGALILAAAPGLLRLELRTDGKALVPPSDPAVVRDAEVREHFGLRDPIVVVIETDHPQGIYNLETLRRVRQLSSALAALDGLGEEQITSLATEHSDRVDAVGGLRFRRFLEKLPQTPEEFERLRGDIEAVDILFGTLISTDRRATAILVGAPPAWTAGLDRTALCLRVAELAAETTQGDARQNDRVAVVGAPVAEALLGRHILEDLVLLLPLAITLMAAVLLVGCRSLWGVALGLGEIGACLVWTFGLMGWLGVPVYLTTAVLPVILVTVGLADEIHILWRYQQVLERGEEGIAAVRTTLAEMTRPVVLTSLTTTVGFFSFLASPLAAVRAFGIFAPLGILFCLFWSLVAIPALLTLLPAERFRRPRRPRPPSDPGLRGQGQGPGFGLAACYRHPRRALAVLALLTIALGAGTWRLRVQDSWIDGFAPQSPFRQATDGVNARFHGTHLLLVHLDLEPLDQPLEHIYYGGPGPLLIPETLRRIGDFEDLARAQPGVGGVLGPFSHLKTVSFLRHARREDMRRIPDRPRDVDTLLHRFDESRGAHRRREIFDDARRRAVVTIFLKDANYRQTAVLMKNLRAAGAEILTPHGIYLDFAGDVAVSQAMIPAIVKSQVSSLLLALGGALAAVSWLLGSLRQGVRVVMPAALAVVWTFGLMGWLGIPLGVATSMFCAITLGIGVDYGIHFAESERRQRIAGAPNPTAAAAVECGPAIVADSLAVALGFGLLAFSQVPSNARLGLLVGVALAATCVLTLVGLGAWRLRRR